MQHNFWKEKIWVIPIRVSVAFATSTTGGDFHNKLLDPSLCYVFIENEPLDGIWMYIFYTNGALMYFQHSACTSIVSDHLTEHHQRLQ